MEELILFFLKFFVLEVLMEKLVHTDTIFVYSESNKIPLCRSLVNLWQFL